MTGEGQDARERLHALVSGRVQGVGYRLFVRRHAWELRLTGWVRNLPDGRVEVLVDGPRPALESLLSLLRRGPRNALVERVEARWSVAEAPSAYFEIR